MREVYDSLKTHFSRIDSVVVTDGRGAQGIKYNGKMFAMFYKGDLTLKFSPQRVDELIKSGRALPHDPGTGKAMTDRVLIPASMTKSWIDLCMESLNYVAGK